MTHTPVKRLAPHGPGVVRPALLLVLLPVLMGQGPGGAPGKSEAGQEKRAKLVEFLTHEAEQFTVYRGAGHAETLELKREPVYVWHNPLRASGQDGAVFLWVRRGRMEVLGNFFTSPSVAPQEVTHEFRSFSLGTLDVSRAAPYRRQWTPEGPGVTLAEIPGAPAPAGSAVSRLSQMHALAREFTGGTQEQDGRRWELRLLPKPLYRYESTDPEVLDGGLFAFVTGAGTDPEALLVLEARKAPGASGQVWSYDLGRFTDHQIKIRHKGKEILSEPLMLGSTPPTNRYHGYWDRPLDAAKGRELGQVP